MRLLSIALLTFALSLTAPAFAQSDQSIKAEVDKIAAAHAENYNKQNAAGIAALYVQGATVVNAAGVQTVVEDNFKNAFKAGFSHQEVTVIQASSIAPDVAIGHGEFTNTGQGQSGPLKVHGRWTAVYVRQDGALKIRLLTAVPIPEPK
jgi:ketosteroid isomerase-like protein